MRFAGRCLLLLLLVPTGAALQTWDFVDATATSGTPPWHATAAGLIAAAGPCEFIEATPDGSRNFTATPCRTLHTVSGSPFLACSEGDLVRLDADGTTLWERPLQAGACHVAAHDPSRGLVFVAFDGADVPTFGAVDTGAGAVHWTRPLWPDLTAVSVQVTEGGLALVASIPCHQATECSAVDQSTPTTRVLLFDRAGTHLGNLTGTSGRTDASQEGIASGAAVWMRLGADAVRFDPLQAGTSDRTRIDPFGDAVAPGPTGPGPVASASGPLFPVRDQVIHLDQTSGARTWTWTVPDGARIIGGIGLDAGSAWLTDTPALHILDADGTRIQRLPVPAGVDQIGQSPAGPYVASASGLLWMGQTDAPPWPDTYYPDADGNVTFYSIGAAAMEATDPAGGSWQAAGGSITLPAAGSWRITALHGGGLTRSIDARLHPGSLPSAPPGTLQGIAISTAYPAIAAPVIIAATDPDIQELFITWPDRLERLRAVDGPVATERTFPGAGTIDVTVTAVYRDGRVEAGEIRFEVGGHPASPNAFDRAFAPENQDMTWGFIGLGVALAGATSGLLIQRQRRVRGRRLFARLDAIRGLVRHDPYAALAGLCAERVEARRKHERGIIDDAQYTLLADRCQDTLARIVALTVSPIRGRLSQPFLARFDATVQDGILEPEERAELRRLLEAESVTSGERAAIGRFIDAWSPSAGAGPED